ncbi:MAG: hypothetical protein QOG20_1875 [Pseudonocardiales bacterium]|jgi:DNA-directed RNA polymerase specialized sigma24 family protein|nr:hypothetical protein [Pseudonocardiales bacterium]
MTARLSLPLFPPADVRPTRDQRRAAAAERLLSALENLVRRHRALALDGEYDGLHAELIAAEVGHELAVTRSALQRHPAVPPPR